MAALLWHCETTAAWDCAPVQSIVHTHFQLALAQSNTALDSFSYRKGKVGLTPDC